MANFIISRLNYKLFLKNSSYELSNSVKHLTVNDMGDQIFMKKFNPLESVTFNNCNKNFIYYNMDPYIFPNTQYIYLNSHPCESTVFSRFYNTNTKIFVSSKYKIYKDWAVRYKNVFFE